MLAHVQRLAVASTTAKQTTHEDVEMVRRFAAAFLTVVFELPLSDVTVVDGERAVLDCHVTATPAAEVTWYVENVEIRQTDGYQIVFTADGWCHLIIRDVILKDAVEGRSRG